MDLLGKCKSWSACAEVNVRESMALLKIIIAPLIIAAFSGAIFAFPGNIHEVYRTLILNTVIYRASGGEANIVLLVSSIVILALGAAIYCACLILIRQLKADVEIRTPLARWTIAFAPVLIAALPTIGVVFGLLEARVGQFSKQAQLDNRFITAAVTEEMSNKIITSVPTSFPASEFASLLQEAKKFAPEQTARIFSGDLDQALEWRAGIFGIVSAAILLGFYCYRARISACGLLSGGRLRYALLAASTVIFVFGISISLWLQSVPEKIGTLSIIGLFFIFILILFGVTSFFSQKWDFPFTFLLVLWVLGLSFFGVNDNHLVRQGPRQKTEGTSRPTLAVSFTQWYLKRPNRTRFDSAGRKYPVYIVAAQGGGIYAAHHSATFLANLNQQAPTFQDHLFAISSVSGGSVGAAIFADTVRLSTAIKDTELRGAVSDDPVCMIETNGQSLEPFVKPVTQAKGRFEAVNFVDDFVLSHDLLSPLVAALAFPDFLQRFLPFKIPLFDRARALEFGIEKAFETAVADYDRKRSAGPQDALKRVGSILKMPYLCHWDPGKSQPALLINTTEVGSGRRRVFAPFTLRDTGLRDYPDTIARRTNLSTAAVLSARFPWITPAGWFREVEPGSEIIRVVDGGYFDNSGILTALQLYDALSHIINSSSELKDKIDLHLIALTGDPASAPDKASDGLNEIADPFRTLLSTWASRGYISTEHAKRRLDTKTDPSNTSVTADRRAFLVRLLPIKYPLPLGWSLSNSTRLLIRVQKGRPELCESKQHFDADCVVAEVRKKIQAP